MKLCSLLFTIPLCFLVFLLFLSLRFSPRKLTTPLSIFCTSTIIRLLLRSLQVDSRHWVIADLSSHSLDLIPFISHLLSLVLCYPLRSSTLCIVLHFSFFLFLTWTVIFYFLLSIYIFFKIFFPFHSSSTFLLHSSYETYYLSLFSFPIPKFFFPSSLIYFLLHLDFIFYFLQHFFFRFSVSYHCSIFPLVFSLL